MQSEFAFLDEIWGPNQTQQQPNPACELMKKNTNNKLSIMDSYLAEQECIESKMKHEQPQMRFEKREPLFDINAVEGYNTYNPLYSQQYAFDEYFADDLKSNKQSSIAIEQPQSTTFVTTEEESPLPRNQIYTDIIEKYNNTKYQQQQKQTSEQYYIELFVYVISGIFLIFFMEQILQLGAKLAKRA